MQGGSIVENLVSSTEFRLCPICDERIDAAATKCEFCGGTLGVCAAAREGANAPPSDSIPVGKVAGLFGCACMVLGCFLPFASVPIFGTVNFLHSGQGDGALVILVAALGAIPLIAGRHHLGSLIAYDVWSVVSRINQAKAHAAGALGANPAGPLGTAWADAVQIQLGPYVIALGCLLVVAGAILENERFLARRAKLRAQGSDVESGPSA